MIDTFTMGAAFLIGMAVGMLALAASLVFVIRRRPSQAKQVCWEAYQVVGSMLSDLGQFGTEQADKILDNLSQARMVHDDVLPWPSFEKRVGIEKMVSAFRGVGLSKGRSIILLAHLMQLPRGEAKRLVHDSEAWADHKAGDEALHESAIREAKKP